MNRLQEYLKTIKIKNYQHQYFTNAFTHSSFLNESNLQSGQDLERLEFIGDSVLQLIVTTYIFQRFDYPQGVLTRLRAYLVCGKQLAAICQKIKLNQFLLLGSGEEKNGGRHKTSILADLVESFAGALYLVEGYQFCNDFFLPIFKNIIDSIDLDIIIDYKSRLQELVQVDEKILINYQVASTTGPANAPTFVIDLYLDNVKLGTGSGNSKKSAEQAAAKMALAKMVKNGTI